MLSRMQFRGVWRDYQARVLEEMDTHLGNGRLHVVAAPGAGKTVLGLEIVRRLDRPALVFAPTVAIRDQWEQRLVPLFLDARPGPDEVSHHLDAPRELTLATYQALDGFRRSDGLDRLIEVLNGRGPMTLVLDEAHHLRREWWNSLDRLAHSLVDVRIVGLTATPPYDASFAEWGRYESLCGPIDLEIGIPELVRNGDLCPHQDQVILSGPTEDTLALLHQRRRAIFELQRDLFADNQLLDALEAHAWLASPEAHVEAILEAPEMLSAMLVLLAAAGRKLPPAPLKLLGVSAGQVPIPSLLWLERLLDGVTHTHAATFDLDAGGRRPCATGCRSRGSSRAAAYDCARRGRSSGCWRPAWPSWRASARSRGRSTRRSATACGWSSCRITSAPTSCRRPRRTRSDPRSWAWSRSSSTCGAPASRSAGWVS